MHGDTQTIELHGPWLRCRQCIDVCWECQPSRNAASGVMVPSEKHNRNASSLEFPNAVDKKQAGIVIRPITIIEVTREDHEIDAFCQRELDQAGECLARSPAQALAWRAPS